MSQQLDQMALIIQTLTGKDMGVGGAAGGSGGSTAAGGQVPASGANGSGSGLASGIMEAQTPMTDYGTKLASRSKPSMAATSNAAKPKV